MHLSGSVLMDQAIHSPCSGAASENEVHTGRSTGHGQFHVRTTDLPLLKQPAQTIEEPELLGGVKAIDDQLIAHDEGHQIGTYQLRHGNAVRIAGGIRRSVACHDR